MYNKDALHELESKFGTDKVIDFCEMVSMLYDLKYRSCVTEDCRFEYDYERDWWLEAGINLKQKKLCLTKNS